MKTDEQVVHVVISYPRVERQVCVHCARAVL